MRGSVLTIFFAVFWSIWTPRFTDSYILTLAFLFSLVDISYSYIYILDIIILFYI